MEKSKLIIGVVVARRAKPCRIEIIGYHHQVRDTIGNTPVMITYCTVCRTGRAFSPYVNGKIESFRLVGMDHFNAMFEDATTGSWWRQSTGEAVIGPLKGAALPEFDSSQTSLRKWFELRPEGLVMQPDEASLENYDKEGKFERGENKGKL